METKSWIYKNMVYISVFAENGGLVKAISKETFVSNYGEYAKTNPKRSRSKHGMLIGRVAIEKCWKCKSEKPITEFNAYGAYESPCYDCCEGKKHKFTLPFEIWFSDIDL